MRSVADQPVVCPAAQVSVSIAEMEAIHERDSAAHAQVAACQGTRSTLCGSTGLG